MAEEAVKVAAPIPSRQSSGQHLLVLQLMILDFAQDVIDVLKGVIVQLKQILPLSCPILLDFMGKSNSLIRISPQDGSHLHCIKIGF